MANQRYFAERRERPGGVNVRIYDHARLPQAEAMTRRDLVGYPFSGATSTENRDCPDGYSLATANGGNCLASMRAGLLEYLT